jgi:hypothetical protein
MSQSKRDDLNLTEVKAVLGRLQRISRNPHAADPQTAADDDVALLSSPRPPAPGPATQGDGLSGTASLQQASPARLVKAVVLIVPLLAVLIGIVIFASIDRQPAPVAALPPLESSAVAPQKPALASAPAQEARRSEPTSALQVASDLMASGRVLAARDVLLRVAQEGSADVAWALARSYDPNYLVTIRAADARPDVAEATRWYRGWYDIAVKQGLVADSVSLDRIIRSMSSN